MTAARWQEEVQWLAVGVGVSIPLGLAVPYAGVMSVALPLALAAAYVLARSVRARGAFVIFGGLLVFQSSDGLSASKAAYVAGLAICAVATIEGASRAPSAARGLIRPLRIGAVAVMALTVVSLVVAESNGNAFADWTRDIVAYALLAYVPLFALDMAKAGPSYARGLLLTAGAVSTITFTLNWLDRRGFATLPSSGLSSLVLCAGFFSYLCGAAYLSKRKLLWTLAAAATIGLLLTTGTRTSVLILIAPLAMAVIPGIGSGRRAVGFAATAAAVLAAFWSIAQLGIVPSQSVTRLVAGADASNAATFYTLEERRLARVSAVQKAKQAPVLGVGPGTHFTFVIPFRANVVFDAITSDTVLTTPAKFGWAGFALLIGVVAAYCCAPVRKGKTPGSLGVFGLMFFVAAYATLASPFEDKGLAFVLMLLLGVAAAERSGTAVAPRATRHPAPPANLRPSAWRKSALGGVKHPSRAG